LAKQNKLSLQDSPVHQTEVTEVIPTAKKQFVEPEISTPVDVLEATTFFQAISSGATN
jgi:hypothetical protein